MVNEFNLLLVLTTQSLDSNLICMLTVDIETWISCTYWYRIHGSIINVVSQIKQLLAFVSIDIWSHHMLIYVFYGLAERRIFFWMRSGVLLLSSNLWILLCILVRLLILICLIAFILNFIFNLLNNLVLDSNDVLWRYKPHYLIFKHSFWDLDFIIILISNFRNLLQHWNHLGFYLFIFS